MAGGRFWFDVSYTRTQQATIGITRTVRRLFGEAQTLGETGALAYHPQGFREVILPEPAGRREVEAAPTFAQRLYRWVTGRIVWRLVIVAVRIVPWMLLRPAWELAANLVFGALSRTASRARFRPNDIIVVADVAWNYPAWRAARRAQRDGARVVLLVHDLMPIRRPDFCFPLVPKVFVTFLHEMLRCCDAVVCNSRATEEDLRRWAQAQRITLPPTGYFHLGSDVRPSAGSTRARPEIEDFLRAPGPCFAAVGSFEPKKNYALLVRVFERLWSGGSQARLLIAGMKTQEAAAFTEALRQHPLQGKLLMTVHDASDADIAEIYSGCQALVFPSLFEGFGLPLVEARTRGCRVVASDLPSFAELADAGVTLYARDDAEALARALQQVAQDTRTPPPYARGLTWRQSTEQFRLRCDALLAAPGVPQRLAAQEALGG
ncbi:MAG TPA: glycosyltransferase [Ramlibacter sp.]|nr:glycosyltransferase [Ramlibacter sp.]